MVKPPGLLLQSYYSLGEISQRKHNLQDNSSRFIETDAVPVTHYSIKAMKETQAPTRNQPLDWGQSSGRFLSTDFWGKQSCSHYTGSHHLQTRQFKNTLHCLICAYHKQNVL